MKISMVIPIWNGSEAIKRNLPKILQAARESGIEEVILSDDASLDDSVEVIKNQFPEVVLVERKINGGFSSNVNSGAVRAKGEFLILLNIDALPERDFLKEVLPHFENPKVFSVGCNVGGLWATGRFKNGFFWHGQGKEGRGEGGGKAHRTLWASGGSSVFRKSIWDELGGLDPLYDPFYEEDVDLGYRATKRGYINLWEPKSRVRHYHEVGAIAGNFSKTTISRTAERNHLLFIWKNITSDRLIAGHKQALAKMLIRHPGYWTVFLDALKRFPRALERRKVEKKQAKLTDEEVFNLFAEDNV